MPLQVRALDRLGGGHYDWLKGKHHFAVDSHGNQAHARLGNLVVWNDDEIAAHSGFAMHGHCDLEIVTYVREGVLQHEDSSGNWGELRAGSVQAITAGRGIRHSEYNDSDARLKIFQIWLLPRRRALEPAWGTKPFPDLQRPSQFVALASGFREDKDALRIQSDARVLGAKLEAGQRIAYPFSYARYGYLVPSRGSIRVNDQQVSEGDGIAVESEVGITITAIEPAEIVLVDTA